MICDLGLVTAKNSPSYIYVRCGTPGYIAPEIIQHTGNTVQDQISDVFSLGTLLHSLVFGSSPFTGKDVKTVMKQNSECKVNFEDNKFKRLDEKLVKLMKVMLKKDPK